MSALRLELSPSPRLALLIITLHCAAGLAAFVVLRGIAGTALCAALAALGVAAAWSRALHRGARSVRIVELEGTGATLVLGNGQRLTGALAEQRYVNRFAVALSLRAPAGRTIFVTPDMLDGKSFRALRLWALWGKVPGVASGQPVA